MKAAFFSDVHLLKDDEGRMKRMEAFFRKVLSSVDQVYILGDLFEFYHGYDKFIYPWYQGAADALKGLTDKGVKVNLLEGNHEFGMGNYFMKYTGVISRREMTIRLDDKEIYIAHGDRADTLCLGTFLKSRFIYYVMDKFGPDLTWKCSQIAGRFISRKIKGDKPKTRKMFRNKASLKVKEGYDVVIFAHSHMADMIYLENEGGKPGMYINTGDFGQWGDYVLYESGKGFSLRRFKATDQKTEIEKRKS